MYEWYSHKFVEEKQNVQEYCSQYTGAAIRHHLEPIAFGLIETKEIEQNQLARST